VILHNGFFIHVDYSLNICLPTSRIFNDDDDDGVGSKESFIMYLLAFSNRRGNSISRYGNCPLIWCAVNKETKKIFMQSKVCICLCHDS